MPRTPTYRIVDHDELGESIAIKTPYIPEFVECLKATIPGKNRRWDPDDKVWIVERVCEDELFSLVSDHYGDEPEWDENVAPGYEAPAPGKPKTSPPADPPSEGKFPAEMAWSVLGLVPAVDPDVAKSAYRILSRKFHPDHGGSNEKMARLNTAWEIIKKVIDAINPPKTTAPEGWAPTDPNDTDDGEVPF